MSWRKYKSTLYSSLAHKLPVRSYGQWLLYSVYLILALVAGVYLLRERIALVYLGTIATIRHNLFPYKFTGPSIEDPYKLLQYHYDVKQFQKLSKEDRCNSYFEKIFPQTKWSFGGLEGQTYWLEALRGEYQQVRAREKAACAERGKTFCETWVKYEHEERYDSNFDFEKYIHKTIPHYKIFNKCYLTDDGDDYNHRTLKVSQGVEDVMFPWFTKQLIDYKDQRQNQGFIDTFRKKKFNSYVDNMKNSYNGRGIAISASNDHFRLLSGLIGLLRAQGNTLPIEIVYRDDFSVWNQEDIIRIATSDEPLDSNDHLAQLFEEIYKDYDSEKIGSLIFNNRTGESFPKQDIRFVNAVSAIKPEYQTLFQAYSNKLVAFYFSSFKEVILMDSDTVPLINLQLFFDNPKYTSKKAFFFRDREIDDPYPQQSVDFFWGLLPNKHDNQYFDLPLISQETLYNNRFLNNSKNHIMESGVVVIDKVRHYNGILLTLALQSWKPVTEPLHGEKELYWMGQLIASDEEFEFNNNFAISLGKTTKKFQEAGTQATELCSTHPGHISDDTKTLYWMNSGFEFCKRKNTFLLDLPVELNYYNEFDSSHVSKYKYDYYNQPLRINAALIPPSTKYTYKNTKPWFEPSKSWVMTKKCDGYLWCAYDLIGGGDFVGDEFRGKVVKFDQQIEKIYDFYGDLWLYYYNSIY